MAESGARNYTTNSSSILVRLGDKAWEIQKEASEDSGREAPADKLSEAPYDDASSTRDLGSRPLLQTRWKAESMRPASRRRSQKMSFRLWKLFQIWIAKCVTYVMQTLFPRQGNRSVASLKGGLLIGMLFGCVAMCLFHQMAPVSATPLGDSASSQGGAKALAASALPAKVISAPGTTVYFVQLGAYPTQAKAATEARILSKQGISTTMVPLDGYSLIATGAVVEQDANAVASQLQKSHVAATVKSFSQGARQLQVLGTAGDSAVNGVERWLAQTSSGLLALDTWLADNGRVADAQMAMASAVQSYPGDDVVAQTGLGDQLTAIDASLEAANRAFQKGDKSAAMNNVIQAFVEMAEIHGING
ncbi:hypothetical protein NZD89_13220 [Alicyclobacillus fastidiosus]|uniref:SPOR domain-containing protein n=2 Tax=Alicyclobacillus fastidiosus TaxID=392011 RepID=A0ABY6ZNV0_9BACL|nr:hypothetical protein [Alicyclobacillus fastidiosus]WAH44253.1 hypothetical protein NZD89_13220 [Alicyclobacillus fastidiosus]GMA60575.1 hypothetical protein GCM10025859_10150 [Alicyclobacillus fastidiosus]